MSNGKTSCVFWFPRKKFSKRGLPEGQPLTGRRFLLLRKLSGVRKLTTFYLTKNDHRWVTFISSKTINSAVSPIRAFKGCRFLDLSEARSRLCRQMMQSAMKRLEQPSVTPVARCLYSFVCRDIARARPLPVPHPPGGRDLYSPEGKREMAARAPRQKKCECSLFREKKE